MPTDKKTIILRYDKPIPKYIQAQDVNNTFGEFTCIVRHDISLVEVPESFVPALLNYREGCCGNTKRNPFKLASADEVERWKA